MLITAGEALTNTAWVALFNSDILVNPRFGKLTRLIPAHLAATGLRLDCWIKSASELDYLMMHPYDVNACNTHGTAAFDFFMWPYG